MIAGIYQDLRYAVRMARKNPAFAVVVKALPIADLFFPAKHFPQSDADYDSRSETNRQSTIGDRRSAMK